MRSVIRLAAAFTSALLCTSALAQIADDLPTPTARPITLDQLTGGDYARGSFEPRGYFDVYDTGVGSETGGGFAGPVNSLAALDDVGFGGLGSTGDVVLTGLAWGCWIPAADFSDHLYMKVSFHDSYDLTPQTVGTPVADPTMASGAPIEWILDIGAGWSAGAGAGLFMADPVTFVNPVTLPASFVGLDRLVGCRMELFTDEACSIRALNHAVMRRANNSSIVVGFSNVQSYFAGIAGDPTINAVSGGTVSGGGRRGTYLALQAAPPNPCDIPLSIDQQPQSQIVCTGELRTLEVGATGWMPTFQWRRDGADMPGATSRILTINVSSPEAAGSYDCVVTNECGQIFSDPAVVTFANNRILAWPTDQVVNVDQPVFFVVEVDEQNNCGPLSFQWERRDPLVLDEADPRAWVAIHNGGGVVGATSPALGILRPTPGLATGYRCRITGDCGCEFRQTSQIYTPTVNFSAACPSDFNLDGSVDGDDVIYFFERWDSGC